MVLDPKKLDFAYRYPFSSEAKEIVQEQPNEISFKYLDMAGRHIGNAIAKDVDFAEISIVSVKLDYLMTYLYSRMILSALKRPDLIRLYAMAEAGRSSRALMSDNADIIKVASHVGVRLTGTFGGKKGADGPENFAMGFVDYVKYSPRTPGFDLVNQKLSRGIVVMDRNDTIKVMGQAIAAWISKGLPIKSSDLPKQVVEYSKGLRFRMASNPQGRTMGKRTEEWIERLLETPIADVRHRTVNLILAPYLVNTKRLEVEQASDIIGKYIDKCRAIDPGTRINDNYIRYQCAYAKRRGLRPLSLERAKELLGSQLDLELQPNRNAK